VNPTPVLYRVAFTGMKQDPGARRTHNLIPPKGSGTAAFAQLKGLGRAVARNPHLVDVYTRPIPAID